MGIARGEENRGESLEKKRKCAREPRALEPWSLGALELAVQAFGSPAEIQFFRKVHKITQITPLRQEPLDHGARKADARAGGNKMRF